VLRDAAGANKLAFQQVKKLPEPTWPEGPRPQMLHLDLTVPTVEELEAQHAPVTVLQAPVHGGATRTVSMTSWRVSAARLASSTPLRLAHSASTGFSSGA
jgi:hypothetical protein